MPLAFSSKAERLSALPIHSARSSPHNILLNCTTILHLSCTRSTNSLFSHCMFCITSSHEFTSTLQKPLLSESIHWKKPQISRNSSGSSIPSLLYAGLSPRRLCFFFFFLIFKNNFSHHLVRFRHKYLFRKHNENTWLHVGTFPTCNQC